MSPQAKAKTPEPAAAPGATGEPLEYVRSHRPFVLRRTVRWSECDPAGVVYTGRFVDYVTAASRSFLEHILGQKVDAYAAEFGVDFPAKAISFVFASSLRPDDKLDVQVRVAGIRNTTFECEFTGTHADGAACFTARMTTICVVPVERRAIRVPDALRARLTPYAI
jgi:4-hydroxybenzoyl-CoA thioesterase